mmetsp:Transcript_2137/g.3992  ORF Transcript_2137/g.3992 Transcript_2137/m.3992 type:complete len:212 (-) Transcript_2137:96-731(-)
MGWWKQSSRWMAWCSACSFTQSASAMPSAGPYSPTSPATHLPSKPPAPPSTLREFRHPPCTLCSGYPPHARPMAVARNTPQTCALPTRQSPLTHALSPPAAAAYQEMTSPPLCSRACGGPRVWYQHARCGTCCPLRRPDAQHAVGCSGALMCLFVYLLPLRELKQLDQQMQCPSTRLLCFKSRPCFCFQQRPRAILLCKYVLRCTMHSRSC